MAEIIIDEEVIKDMIREKKYNPTKLNPYSMGWTDALREVLKRSWRRRT